MAHLHEFQEDDRSCGNAAPACEKVGPAGALNAREAERALAHPPSKRQAHKMLN